MQLGDPSLFCQFVLFQEGLSDVWIFNLKNDCVNLDLLSLFTSFIKIRNCSDQNIWLMLFGSSGRMLTVAAAVPHRRQVIVYSCKKH